MRSKYEVKFQIENCKIERGIAEMPFSPFFCRNHLTCMWNRISLMSLDRWRIGQWNLYRYSSWVSIIIFNFNLDRERRFLYEFSVEKMVLVGFRGYLGEIESEKITLYQVEFFIQELFFLMHVQRCVRVSASNLQVLTRKSGLVTRAFGNIVRFLAGPARIVWSYCIYL